MIACLEIQCVAHGYKKLFGLRKCVRKNHIIARRSISRVLSLFPGDGHSSRRSLARERSSNQPERHQREDPPARKRVAPIRSCSRRGLPCPPHCWVGGALLPHLFTLTFTMEGGLFSVALSLGVEMAPAGRYPAPHLHGARTFLGGRKPDATVQPSGDAFIWR